MPVLVKKANGKQKSWIKEYERVTGFECMHQDELDKKKISFVEFCRKNLRWFQDWSQECYDALESSYPGDRFV